MTRRRKLIAQADRKRRALEREREAQELKENYERLRTMTAGFSTRKGRIKKSLSPNPPTPRYNPEEPLRQRLGAHTLPDDRPQVLTPGMRAREEEALRRTEELKSRVGQVGNKMGLQYLTDSDLEDSKKGLLRRRS